MSDLTERLRNHTIRFAHESEIEAKIRRNKAVAEAADEIDRLTRELAEARRERDLLAYHVAPHTDEAFRSSHCAEQIIDAGLQGRQRELAEARDKALEEAAKVAETPRTYRFDDGTPPIRQPLPSGLAIAAGIRALKEKPNAE